MRTRGYPEQSFFFPRKSKVPVKHVFCLFWIFFPSAKTFFTGKYFFRNLHSYRPNFYGCFLGFFHGFPLRFHGHKTKKIHGRDLFFKGRIFEKKSKERKIIICIRINTKKLFKKSYFKKNRVFLPALLDFSRSQFVKYFTCTNFSFTGRNLF